MTWLKLVEGYMPMQMISELAISILIFAAINFSLKKAGVGIPKFWAGVGVWIFILMYLKYRIYPPIPVQRAGHLWDGLRLRDLHVGLGLAAGVGRL